MSKKRTGGKTVLAQVEGFTPVIDVLVEQYGGIITAAVFGRVWRYCQMRDKVCNASLQTIAGGLGLGYQTVLRHVKTLCNDGYLVDLTPDLRNHPHIYVDTGKVGMQVSVRAGLTEKTDPQLPEKQTPSTTTLVDHSTTTLVDHSTTREVDEDSLREIKETTTQPVVCSPSTSQTENPDSIADEILEQGADLGIRKVVLESAIASHGAPWVQDCLRAASGAKSPPAFFQAALRDGYDFSSQERSDEDRLREKAKSCQRGYQRLLEGDGCSIYLSQRRFSECEYCQWRTDRMAAEAEASHRALAELRAAADKMRA